MSDEPRPLSDAEIQDWEEQEKLCPDLPWSFGDQARLMATVLSQRATIRDRDKKLAAYQASAEDLSKALDDTRRAEAFALYRDSLNDARVDASHFEVYAKIAVRNAAAFNEAWENRE